MNSSELERLITALETDLLLAEEFRALTDDPLAWSDWANGRGYAILAHEADRLAEIYGEIDDEDLEDVAGGWSSGGG